MPKEDPHTARRIVPLLPSMESSGMPKKYAYIPFLVEGETILDIKVYDMRLIKNLPALLAREYAGQSYRFCDIGAILSDWDEWTLQDLLYKFGFQYFMPSEKRFYALNALAQIEEFRDTIQGYFDLDNF